MQQATTLDRVRALEGTRGRRVWAHLRTHALPYLLILPSLIFLAAVEFYPLGRGILEGFKYHNRVQPWATRYNGLDNFRRAFESHDVRLALRNSIVIVTGIVVCSYLLGLVAGLILHQRTLRFRAIYRTLILIPWVTPPIAAYISWQWMLNDFGIVNRVLYQLGFVNKIEPVLFLGEPNLALGSVIMVGTWFRFPFMMITILAALSAIPDDLYEAASLDGANPIQSFRDITLPLIVPVSVIATLLQAIWTFNDFGLTYILTGGGPANATLTLILLAYREAFQRPNIGFGTSLAIISMVLMLGVGAVYLRLQARYQAPA